MCVYRWEGVASREKDVKMGGGIPLVLRGLGNNGRCFGDVEKFAPWALRECGDSILSKSEDVLTV